MLPNSINVKFKNKQVIYDDREQNSGDLQDIRICWKEAGRELSGIMKLVYILIWVLVIQMHLFVIITKVYTYNVCTFLHLTISQFHKIKYIALLSIEPLRKSHYSITIVGVGKNKGCYGYYFPCRILFYFFMRFRIFLIL